MILELHRRTPNNIGDYYCNPSRYFEIPDVETKELTNFNNCQNQNVIIGGGGLIHKKFGKQIKSILESKPKLSVIWSIGHNFGEKHITKSKDPVYYPDWLMKADLIGIRDYIEGYKKFYVPCVTCMHPAFDKKYSPKHEVVYFTHAFKSSFSNQNNMPVMTNNSKDFNKVIEFLGSGETVVTDSYHGAYWAQLLGRNVQTTSWSVKFKHLKNSVHFLDNINQSVIKSLNAPSSEFLDESRTLNKNLYQKLLNKL